MSPPAKEPQICALCEQNEATTRYTYKTFDGMVCDACFEEYTVQDAFNDQLLHILTLKSDQKYDEALACLDAIWKAYGHRDRTKWLARTIEMQRCDILTVADRYAEAEKASKAWAELGFEDVCRRWLHACMTAPVLDALGRTREAVALLESSLEYRENKHLSGASLVLEPLVELSEKLGEPVSPKARPLAEAYAWVYGVEMPVAHSLGDAIRELVERTRGMQPVFERYTQPDAQADVKKKKQ